MSAHVTATDLRALLARLVVAPEGRARYALDVALKTLDDPSRVPSLRDASAALRERYEVAVGRGPGTRRAPGTYPHRHEQRFDVPWSDPMGDAAEHHPLADCVAAVYAVEAHVTGEHPSRVGYYARAVGHWPAEVSGAW